MYNAVKSIIHTYYTDTSTTEHTAQVTNVLYFTNVIEN